MAKTAITWILSEPASRSQADDADDWRDVVSERRDLVARLGFVKQRKGKVKLVRDHLTITFPFAMSEDDVREIVEGRDPYEVITQSGQLAPDEIQVEIT